jgi:hypothetical protein
MYVRNWSKNKRYIYVNKMSDTSYHNDFITLSQTALYMHMYFQTRFSVGISILKKAVKMVTFVSP